MATARGCLRRVATSVVVIVVLLVAGVALLSAFEPRLIFFPSRGDVARPEELGVPFEEVLLPSSGGVTVQGYAFTPPGEARAWLLVSHGNGGNVSSELHLARLLVERRFAVLLYDYRG
jgi:uncharacterized protein